MYQSLIGHYVKTAWRVISRYRRQSLVGIVGIAIGFTAFILGGYWWYWEAHFDTFHPYADRTYAITMTGINSTAGGEEEDLNQLHRQDLEYFKRVLPEVERFCRVYPGYFWLEEEGEQRQCTDLSVDSNFFAVFQARLLAGSYQGIPFDGRSVLLTEKFAHRMFGGIDCVGKKLQTGGWKDTETKTVVGVIADYPGNTEFMFDVVNLEMGETVTKRQPTYLLLKENVNVSQVRKKIENHQSVAIADLYNQPERWKFHLRSLPQLHFTCHGALEHRFRNIRILLLAGLLAFVSALMNHLVIFAAQQQRKQRVNFTYAYLGSTSGGLMFRGMIELLLLLLLSFALSYCLTELIFPWYQQFTGLEHAGIYSAFTSSVTREALFLHILYYMSVSTFGFVVICWFPVRWLMVRGHRQNSGKSSAKFRKLLIVAQVFIGSLLFLASLGLYKQLRFMQHSDKGITVDHILQIDLGSRTTDAVNLFSLKQDILQSPLVEDATMTTDAILTKAGEWYTNYITAIPSIAEEKNEEFLLFVEKNFLSFFHVVLKEGNWPETDEKGVLVINETGKRKIGLPSLEEYAYTFKGGITERVVGVVRDFHYWPLQFPLKPLVIQVNDPAELNAAKFRYLYVKYHPQTKKRLMPFIYSCVDKYDTGEVGSDKKYVELSSYIEEFNRPEEIIFRLFLILALTCILISSFGIYSLVNLSLEQRRKEIAIRKVNGAAFSGIFCLFVREYAGLVIIGNVLSGIAGYWLLQQWLQTYAYHTSLGGGIFLIVLGATSLLVLYSIYIQIHKITRENPAEAFKTE